MTCCCGDSSCGELVAFIHDALTGAWTTLTPSLVVVHLAWEGW